MCVIYTVLFLIETDHSIQVVFNKEKAGIERYIESVAKIRQLITGGAGKPQQDHSDAVALYLEAAAVKPAFDRLAQVEIPKYYEKRSGVKVGWCPLFLHALNRVNHGTATKNRFDELTTIVTIIIIMLTYPRCVFVLALRIWISVYARR